MLVGANGKLEVFRKNYARLVNVLPTKSLIHPFVTEKIINSDEEETILQAAGQSEAAGMVLRKIGHSLEANLTKSFDKLLCIMEQHGGASCAELVSEIRQELPQDVIGKPLLTMKYLHACTELSIYITISIMLYIYS